MFPTETLVDLSRWQFALTATDANRFALRMARMITERPKVLVFNYCYHGSVDETFITLDEEGTPMPRANNMGPQVDPRYTSRFLEQAAETRKLSPL